MTGSLDAPMNSWDSSRSTSCIREHFHLTVKELRCSSIVSNAILKLSILTINSSQKGHFFSREARIHPIPMLGKLRFEPRRLPNVRLSQILEPLLLQLHYLKKLDDAFPSKESAVVSGVILLMIAYLFYTPDSHDLSEGNMKNVPDA